MKYILTSLMVLIFSMQMVAQSPATPSYKMEEAFDKAMKELQSAMDTIDLESIFSENFGMMFTDSTSTGMDGLFGQFDMSQLFGPEMQSQMEESLKMLDNLDMDEMQSLMEGIDMSQIEDMMKGFNMEDMEGMFEGFDMKEMEKMFEGMDLSTPNQDKPTDTKPTDKKSKKLKKL